jgi:hypothetical protein
MNPYQSFLMNLLYLNFLKSQKFQSYLMNR